MAFLLLCYVTLETCSWLYAQILTAKHVYISQSLLVIKITQDNHDKVFARN